MATTITRHHSSRLLLVELCDITCVQIIPVNSNRRFYMSLATAFGYYGIALLSPLIIQKGSLRLDDRGSNETHYEDMVDIMPCSGFTQRNYIDLLWTSAAEFPGLIIFTFLIERMRRKVLLSGACFFSSVLTLLLLLNTHKIVILLFLFAARAVLCAIFQLNYIMTSEAYPTTFRAIAMGTGTSFCRLGGLIVPYVTQRPRGHGCGVEEFEEEADMVLE
ncbi:synaptic vesicle 2-related protein [Trichonephila clavipes]|uniref:Synaptic vesicle 2-related protein n=1 Tax=Trichonephila clavipes TaxID=2585209 RepID=A0A8X6S941_TRICX|nr:synaptic vesicle 2-related protein [Trichonephila clavipes]